MTITLLGLHSLSSGARKSKIELQNHMVVSENRAMNSTWKTTKF